MDGMAKKGHIYPLQNLRFLFDLFGTFIITQIIIFVNGFETEKPDCFFAIGKFFRPYTGDQ